MTKAFMPVQAKALLPDEIDGFLNGKVPWRILAIPFGGPIPSPKSARGVDLDGQFFSERTDIFGPFAALKASRERFVDWHHSLKPMGRATGDPTGVMSGVALGKAVLDSEPDESGWWVDFWARQGEKRLDLVRSLVERGTQLFGSAQPTALEHTHVEDSGEITRYPFLLETITTSPQNTLSVVRPKALLDDLNDSELTINPAIRALLGELDALGADLPRTFPLGGDAAAKAGGVLSALGAVDNALDAWESLRDRLRSGQTKE